MIKHPDTNNKSVSFYTVEPFFDGIRKNNARMIFGILLIILIIDFVLSIIIT
jgi:hypothetical protein